MTSLSIVTTTHNSSATLPEYVKRITASAKKVSQEFEIIFVDDGSSDNSVEILRQKKFDSIAIKIIQLSRNFGHHVAMLEGLKAADGDLVFLIDCDLEEPPELLVSFYDKMKNEDSDVVYGVQTKRTRGHWIDKLLGRFFYTAYNFLSDTKIPKNLCVVRLMNNKFVRSLDLYAEKELIIGSIWAMAGFKQIPLDVKVEYKGASSYSLKRRFIMAIDAVISTSVKPLRIYFFFSLTVAILAFFMLIWVVILYLFFGQTVPGFYTITLSIWFTAGFVSTGLGLIGLYASVIMKEIKNRPRTVIKSIFENKSFIERKKSA